MRWLSAGPRPERSSPARLAAMLLACSLGCTQRGTLEAGAAPAPAGPGAPRSGSTARAPAPGVPSRVPGALDCGGAPCALDDVCLACGTDVFHCVPAASICCGTLPCPPGSVCLACPPGDVPTCLPEGTACPPR